MTAYQHRDSTQPHPVVPPQCLSVRLHCGCGGTSYYRDDVSLGELVDWLATPAMRGYPEGCPCELNPDRYRPLSLDLSA